MRKAVDKLLALSEPWARRNPETKGFFHKGRDYRAEIDKARRRWVFDLVIHPSMIERDSVILEIGGIQSL